MAIDLFATRYMLNAVTQFKRPKRYFLDTYFPGIKIFDTETVDVDVIKNKRVMAPFQSPLTEGKVMDKTGFSSHALKPAYVKPKDVTTAQQLLTRTPGSVVYPGTQTMADRAAIRLAQDFMLLQDSIVRHRRGDQHPGRLPDGRQPQGHPAGYGPLVQQGERCGWEVLL
jgi:hypothetical protein